MGLTGVQCSYACGSGKSPPSAAVLNGRRWFYMQVDTLKGEQKDILSEQATLKQFLYGKFGDAINLEEHETA